MIEIAQTYLGNLTEDPHLVSRIEASSEPCLEVYLRESDRRKGRIQAQSTLGIALGIIKSRDWLIRSQDVFLTESQQLLLIHLQEQKLMVLSFREPLTAKAAVLVYLGHVLGNHHYPIKIAEHKIYLASAGDFAVMEKTIRELNIADLVISYEYHLPDQALNFSSHHHH